MINAAELRKGNLLNRSLKLEHPQTTLPDELVEVSAVHGDKIAYLYPNIENRVEPFEDKNAEKANDLIPLQELLPIPLTDEWLGKAGLVVDRQAASIQTFNFQWNGEKLEHETNNAAIPAKPIQFVHELQNYFQDATGRQLDINFNGQ